MIPEYFNYLLTGNMLNEYTNATSTALVNAYTRSWDDTVIAALGLPRRIFGPLNLPGARVGRFTGEVQGAVGFDCDVLLPATHDTGSAFLAVPARDENAVYISSGTWSLLGVENEAPITGEASMLANFTNEGGYRYRYRYLKNIMGLWMIQSIRRELNGRFLCGGSKTAAVAKRQWSYAELEAEARGCAILRPGLTSRQQLPCTGEYDRCGEAILRTDRTVGAANRRRADAMCICQPGRRICGRCSGAVRADGKSIYQYQHCGRRQQGRLSE